MKTTICMLALLAIGVFLAGGIGCGTVEDGGDGFTPSDGDNGGGGGNGGGNGGSSGDALPAVVKTSIVLRSHGLLNPDGKIEAGDDLIVYGLPGGSVYYFTPSVSDRETNVATEIPGSSTEFGYRNFKVAGKKVALVRDNYEVAIYDTAAGTLTDIPGGDITLDRLVLPVEANAPGHMASDGSLIATVNDTNAVDDGNAIKVIDVSAATPTVISVPNPPSFLGGFRQVAVDVETHTVAAYGDNPGVLIYAFDIDDPAAAPLEFDLFGEGFQDNVQMAFDSGAIIYNQGSDIALLDVTAPGNAPVVFTNNPSNNSAPVAIRGGSFGYFQFASGADMGPGPSEYRSAIGRVADAPASTLAGQSDLVFNGNAPECVAEDALLGYGTTMAITPDGSRWFLAGTAGPDDNYDHLQMSVGGAFETFTDPDGDTQTGLLMASDVSCSSNTVAFRALRQTSSSGCLADEEWVIGFIILDRLDD